MATPSKRQCIKSYFGRAIESRSDTYQSLSPTPHKSSNLQLPASIQSSLLNVGMRVRESVPEGYKIRRKPTSNPSLEACVPSDYYSNSTSTIPAYTGLVPCCGIFNIGLGSSQQEQAPAEEDLPPLQFDDEDLSLSLPSSQELLACSIPMTPDANSTQPFTNDRKRLRQDANGEDLGFHSQAISPRSRPISHTRMPNLDEVRPIALPKTRKKRTSNPMNEGGEFKESDMVDVGDFGDVPFLQLEHESREWL